jgi:hypothetical protein
VSSLKQRTHPRCPCRMPVKMATGDAELDGFAVNVGLGGMYIESETLPPFNHEVTVRFRLPNLDEDTVVVGTVRWVRNGGAGIQFGSLRARDVWALNQLLRTVA